MWEPCTVIRGAGEINGSVEVAPTTLDTNAGLMGWLEMAVTPVHATKPGTRRMPLAPTLSFGSYM